MSIYGASPEEWKRLADMGIISELLPVVCNPNAKRSENSTIQYPGKFPTRYVGNASDKIYSGIHDWSNHQTTKSEAVQWSKEPDYGICIQTRIIRAFDVDVTDKHYADEIEKFIETELGVELPKRYRADSNKFLLAFKCDGNFPKKEIVVRTYDIKENGKPKQVKEKIEFLATGQQFKAYGLYLKGDGKEGQTKLQWDWRGYSDRFPELSQSKADEIWGKLIKEFGLSIPTEVGYRDIKVHSKHKSSIFQQQGFSIDVVKDMLNHISPDIGYDDWYKIAAALQDGGYPFQLWDDWSKGSSKYKQGEMIAKWNSFQQGGGISMGTLYHKAKQAGWEPSKKTIIPQK